MWQEKTEGKGEPTLTVRQLGQGRSGDNAWS